MNKDVTLSELSELISEQLANGGEAVLTVNGSSMMPLLKNGSDSVVLVSPVLPLKKYDIPLYRRKDGSFVLHRVIKVKGGTYTCRGDGQISSESGVTDDMVVGIAVARIRDGARNGFSEFGMKFYAFFRVNTAFVRRIYFGLKRRLRRK